jgi:beta-RFAP synthase
MARGVQVHVLAHARLHLGFLDLNGALGRQFGSIGMALEDVALELVATPGTGFRVSGPGSARADAVARTVMEELGHGGGADIRILRGIPEHAGLGSGTQLALAVGTACARLAGAAMSTVEIAHRLMRGQRSGIGIGAFTQGGFIVDGGRGTATEVPPVVSRLPVPDAWRVVLVMDRSRQGVYGEEERRAFAEISPMPEAQSAHLCRLVLRRLLPALAESDCTAFGAAISEIQKIIGGCFSRRQSGAFTSPDVEIVLTAMKDWGATGTGQSSWGPTGFAIFPDSAAAARAVDLARGRWHDNARLDFVSCRAANHPASIRSDTAARHAHG